MDEATILVPDAKTVKVGDKDYTLKKLTLLQIIKVGKLLSKAVLTSRDKLKQLKEDTKDSTSNTDDMLSMLQLLEEEDVIVLFGIILAEKNPEVLKAKLTFEVAVEIVTIVAEQNGIEGIKQNFSRLGKLMESGGKK